MQSRPNRGLLLLLGGLAVALTMNAFPHPIMLASGAAPPPVTSLATHKALFVTAPAGAFFFHSSGLGTLACVVFSSSTVLRLGPDSSN